MIVLQPRRVAARATAARIASEQGWTLGEEVGYQVRLERIISPRTRLRIQTEGILTRQLLADPFLETIGAVVLDEFHERSLHVDFALALLREIRREVRPDLIVLVMSATLDAAPVSRFLDDCPIETVPGSPHPVELEYRSATRPASPAAVTPVVREVLDDPRHAGHILVFLPGMAEIRRVEHALLPLAQERGCDVHLLHGSLPAAEQDRALAPGDRRKIILATNIAETSLTIDGVSTVIDSGLARSAHHDQERGSIVLNWARSAWPRPRSARPGGSDRTGPVHSALGGSRGARNASVRIPEVHRVDLCSAVLAVHSWGVHDPAAFGWFDPPAPERLEPATRLLVSLEALHPANGRITPLGKEMLALPVHPRLARLLLASAQQQHAFEGAGLCALISEKDIAARQSSEGSQPGRRAVTADRGRSDLLLRLDRLAEAEQARFSASLSRRGIDPAAAQVARVRDQLHRLASRLESKKPRDARNQWDRDSQDDEMMLKWLILAYPDRVVRRHGSGETGVMVGGRGVRLSPESIVREGEFFLALDAREERRQGVLELQVNLASYVRLEWLEELMPELLRRERATCFDADRQRVVGVVRLFFQDLLVREDASQAVDPVEAAACLAAALRPGCRAFSRRSPGRELAGPLRFRSPGNPRTRLARHGRAGPRRTAARSLSGKQERAGNSPGREGSPSGEPAHAGPAPGDRPERTGGARGSQRPGGPPDLRTGPAARAGRSLAGAVRLDRDASPGTRPRAGAARASRAPNHRPVQITSDLKSFWTTTYHQVRKDLRAGIPSIHGRKTRSRPSPWPGPGGRAAEPGRASVTVPRPIAHHLGERPSG